MNISKQRETLRDLAKRVKELSEAPKQKAKKIRSAQSICRIQDKNVVLSVLLLIVGASPLPVGNGAGVG